MASTNVYINVKTVKYGSSGTPLTSVKHVSVTDNTEMRQDGTDNDTQFTYSKHGQKKCSGEISVRDIKQADLMCNQSGGNLFFTYNADQGTDANRIIENCATGATPEGGGVDWDGINLFNVKFVGGASRPYLS